MVYGPLHHLSQCLFQPTLAFFMPTHTTQPSWYMGHMTILLSTQLDKRGIHTSCCSPHQAHTSPQLNSVVEHGCGILLSQQASPPARLHCDIQRCYSCYAFGCSLPTFSSSWSRLPPPPSPPAPAPPPTSSSWLFVLLTLRMRCHLYEYRVFS